ncbi:MAG TPA: VWA domain-containing protein [Vicinamibacterales bacterium]
MPTLRRRPRPQAAIARLAGAIVIVLIAAIRSGPNRPSAQARFRGGIDLVEADAIVLSADGRAATGLTAADFTLSVDGQSRAIESVEYVDAAAGGPSRPNTARGATAAPSPRPPQRHIVFVIDEGNIDAGGGKAAIAAAGKLLDRFGAADRVALLSIPRGPSVDFTSERAPIRAALTGSVGRAARLTSADDFTMSLREAFAFDVGATADERQMQQAVLGRECPLTMPAGRRELCEASLRADAEVRLESYRTRSRDAIAGLDKLFRTLTSMSGPKVVVLVSEGLLLRPDHRDESLVSQLAALAVTSRVTLYSVLIDGPLVDGGEAERVHSSTAVQDRAIEEDGLRALTFESGGLLFRAPAGPDSAFQRLGDALSGYYLVSFRLTAADGDGPHAISLRTTRLGATIHARARFLVPTSARRPPSATVGVGASSFTLDKAKLLVSTRAIADAGGLVRILFSLDMNDGTAHTSALALGYKLTSGSRIVADSGRVVPVTRGIDGVAEPISYIAFQALPPGTYELRLSVSDGTKHSAVVTHPVSARLHTIGAFTLSDLLLAAAAASEQGPFPVPARTAVTGQVVAGVDVAAGVAAAFANAAVRFEVASTKTQEIVASHDVSLSPGGPLDQFIRATLNLSGAAAGEYRARASVLVDGVAIGSIEAPMALTK